MPGKGIRTMIDARAAEKDEACGMVETVRDYAAFCEDLLTEKAH